MKYLVLGGCGFIGSHVVDALAARGLSVRVLDKNPERFRPEVARVEYLYGSFLDRADLLEALNGMDVVLHLISTTMPGTANMDPATDVSDNLVGTIGLLNAMVDLKIRRIVFLSSGGTVYGVPEVVPIPETHPLRPIGSYGIVKVAIESYLEMYGRLRGLSATVLRASNPYGPRQGHVGLQGVVSTFMRRVWDGEPVEVWGDGSVMRDYIYISDLAELCALASVRDEPGVYNAGSGSAASVNDILAHIRKVTGKKTIVNYLPGRGIDVPRSVLDITRARDVFGWRPRTEIDMGFAKTWEWISRPA